MVHKQRHKGKVITAGCNDALKTVSSLWMKLTWNNLYVLKETLESFQIHGCGITAPGHTCKIVQLKSHPSRTCLHATLLTPNNTNTFMHIKKTHQLFHFPLPLAYVFFSEASLFTHIFHSFLYLLCHQSIMIKPISHIADPLNPLTPPTFIFILATCRIYGMVLFSSSRFLFYPYIRNFYPLFLTSSFLSVLVPVDHRI